MTDLSAVFNSLHSLASLLKQMFILAFQDPTGGLIIGGLLIVLGRAGRALTAAGVVVVAYALLSIILPQLGVKVPWR